jgi:hypothetical protein
LGDVSLRWLNGSRFVPVGTELLEMGTELRLVASPADNTHRLVSVNFSDREKHTITQNSPGNYTIILGADLDIAVVFERNRFEIWQQNWSLDANDFISSPVRSDNTFYAEMYGDGYDNVELEIIVPDNLVESDNLRFVRWQILNSDGERIELSFATTPSVTVAPNGRISHFEITTDFANNFEDTTNNRIIFIAVYSENTNTRLNISVRNGPDNIAQMYFLAPAASDIAAPSQYYYSANTDVKIMPHYQTLVNFDFKGYLINGVGIGDIDVALTNGTVHTYAQAVDARIIAGFANHGLFHEITLTMNAPKNVTLVFERKEFNLTIIESTSGGEWVFVERPFQLYDTISLTFNPDAMFDIRSMTIGTMSIDDIIAALPIGTVRRTGNTVNITVNEAWLAFVRLAPIGWLDGTTNTLTLELDVDTAMNTFVIVGFGGTGAAAVGGAIGIAIFAVQIRRKKKDYALALERHREASKRMDSASVIGDLVKKAKEGGAE